MSSRISLCAIKRYSKTSAVHDFQLNLKYDSISTREYIDKNENKNIDNNLQSFMNDSYIIAEITDTQISFQFVLYENHNSNGNHINITEDINAIDDWTVAEYDTGILARDNILIDVRNDHSLNIIDNYLRKNNTNNQSSLMDVRSQQDLLTKRFLGLPWILMKKLKFIYFIY